MVSEVVTRQMITGMSFQCEVLAKSFARVISFHVLYKV